MTHTASSKKDWKSKESGFYPNDEQLARGFGDDVLMVGNSCGVGALKGWDGTKATHIEPIAFRTESILAYGPVRTIVDVTVKGWNYQGKELNMTNRYILYAGHRDLLVETSFDEPLENEVFCTGVQNIMGNETRSESDHKGLIGSWEALAGQRHRKIRQRDSGHCHLCSSEIYPSGSKR